MKSPIAGFAVMLLLLTPAGAASPEVAQTRATGTAPAKPSNMHDTAGYYPPLSQRLGEEGTVDVSFLVGTDGHVTDPKVAHSSGYPRLDEAACAAVRKWTYHPQMQDGVAVASRRTVHVKFVLGADGIRYKPGPDHSRPPVAAMTTRQLWDAMKVSQSPIYIPLLIASAMFAVVLVMMYFLPALLAVYDRHPRRVWIVILNLLFGWTVLGWIALFAWAFGDPNARNKAAKA